MNDQDNQFPNKIIESNGFIVAGLTAIFSLGLFYSENQSFFGSLFAALIAAGLIWVTYIILRIFFLALKK